MFAKFKKAGAKQDTNNQDPEPNRCFPNGDNTGFDPSPNREKKEVETSKIKSSAKSKSRRPGGGWESDEDEDKGLQIGTGKLEGPYKIDDVEVSKFENSKKKSAPKKDGPYDARIYDCDKQFLKKYSHETKIVEDFVQPGGAKIKPADSLIEEFSLKCQFLDSVIIGSLLFGQINQEKIWIKAARALYGMDALIRKYENYYFYFKQNIKILRNLDFGHFQSNDANQLSQILDNYVLLSIEEPTSDMKQRVQRLKLIKKQMEENNGQVDLLTGFDDNTNPDQQASEQQAQTISATDDLLGGDSQAEQPMTIQNNQNDPKHKKKFDKFKKSSKQPQNQTQFDNAFDLLDSKNEATTFQQQHQQQQQQPPKASDDPFAQIGKMNLGPKESNSNKPQNGNSNFTNNVSNGWNLNGNNNNVQQPQWQQQQQKQQYQYNATPPQKKNYDAWDTLGMQMNYGGSNHSMQQQREQQKRQEIEKKFDALL